MEYVHHGKAMDNLLITNLVGFGLKSFLRYLREKTAVATLAAIAMISTDPSTTTMIVTTTWFISGFGDGPGVELLTTVTASALHVHCISQ